MYGVFNLFSMPGDFVYSHGFQFRNYPPNVMKGISADPFPYHSVSVSDGNETYWAGGDIPIPDLYLSLADLVAKT